MRARARAEQAMADFAYLIDDLRENWGAAESAATMPRTEASSRRLVDDERVIGRWLAGDFMDNEHLDRDEQREQLEKETNKLKAKYAQ